MLIKLLNDDSAKVGNAININPIQLIFFAVVLLNRYPIKGLINSAATAARVVTSPVTVFSAPRKDKYAGAPAVAILKPRKPRAFTVSIVIKSNVHNACFECAFETLFT